MPNLLVDEGKYRAWLAEQTESIDIRGIAGDYVRSVNPTPLPILKLYANLYAEEKLSHAALDAGKIKGEKRELLTDLAKSVRCLAIYGEPGSGKTTFLRYLAQKELQDTSQKTIPFYISLEDVFTYVEELRKGKAVSLPSNKMAPSDFLLFLADQSNKRGWNLSYAYLEEIAKEGRAFWLLDGLDELPSYDARVVTVKLVEEASRLWKTCRFILTSRPLAMTGEAVPLGFEVVGIGPLSDYEIGKFLQDWTQLILSNQSDEHRREYLVSLERSIRGIEFERIRDLARNPVMLTCMAVIFHNQKHLPESKAGLLEAMITWLIRSRKRPPGMSLGSSQFTETAFRKLAYSMFLSPQGRKTRVGLNWAAEVISKSLGCTPDEALGFLRHEALSSGVVALRGLGNIEFWHPLFLEYMAAREIAGKVDDERKGWWPVVRKNLGKPEWSEVISFVAACLLSLGEERVNLLFERLADMCAHTTLTERARIIGLGGSVLKDLRAYDYDARAVTQWVSMMSEVESMLYATDATESLTLLERYNIATAYGQLGDPRISNFEETWAKLPGGTFEVGAQADSPSSPNFDEFATKWEGPVLKVKLPPFEIRKYLVTVSEYSQFVLEGGYEAIDNWTQEGWAWRNQNRITAPARWDSQLLTPNCPVTGISWHEASAYCKWLTSKDGSKNRRYRLPRECEWEYAARRATPNLRFPWGNSLSYGDRAEANWLGAGLGRVTPVGMFPKSNTIDGISDMVGNVEEWCLEAWPIPDWPRLVRGKTMTIVKGGSTIRVSRLCRPTYRSACNQENRYATLGFRCLRELLQNA